MKVMPFENHIDVDFNCDKKGKNRAKVTEVSGKYNTFQKNGFVSIKILKYPTPTNKNITTKPPTKAILFF